MEEGYTYTYECKELQLTLNSANNLQNPRTFLNFRAYVKVSVTGSNIIADQVKKSPIDMNGGTDPLWNCVMNFKTEPGMQLKIKVYCDRSLKFDKCIGRLQLSVSELLEGPMQGGGQIFQLQNPIPNGNEAGTINLLYSFRDVMIRLHNNQRTSSTSHTSSVAGASLAVKVAFKAAMAAVFAGCGGFGFDTGYD